MKTIVSTAFEDDEDDVHVAKDLYIFDYNPKINTVNLSKNFKDLKVVSIYKNCIDEIIVVQEKKVSIMYL